MGANIYPPCVSNALDQYLSEPVFAQNQCKIEAENLSTEALIVM